MPKKYALWLMVGGAAVSLYDLATGNSLYGAGKPLEKMRWLVYTTAGGSNYYVSISDAAALAGAVFYFL